MNREIVEQIVESVLYEGYMLYPYRPSVKNRQRWTFGGLFPRGFSEAHATGDAWSVADRVPGARVGTDGSFGAQIRFLHLQSRTVRQLDSPLDELPAGGEPASRIVDGLRVGEQWLQTWQEAEERSLPLESFSAGQPARTAGEPRATVSRVPASGITSAGGEIRRSPGPGAERLVVTTDLTAVEVGEGLFKLRLCVQNRTSLEDPSRTSRDEAQMSSLVSTHAILRVEGGEFESLIDPADDCREAAGACRNVGTWPVLVGSGRRERHAPFASRSSSMITRRSRRKAPEISSTEPRSTRYSRSAS